MLTDDHQGYQDVSILCYSFKEGDVSVIRSELGADVHSSLVTFARETTPDPPPDLYKLVFLAQSTEPTFMEGVTCTLQRV